jgi:hypothetical protein
MISAERDFTSDISFSRKQKSLPSVIPQKAKPSQPITICEMRNPDAFSPRKSLSNIKDNKGTESCIKCRMPKKE